MTREQVEQAQALSRDWKPGMPLPEHAHAGG